MAKPADNREVAEESQIAALLETRFGDGLSYHNRKNSQQLINLAIKQGFLDNEGYLTRKGRSLMTRYHFT